MNTGASRPEGAEANARLRVSVIIVNYNTGTLLEQCCHSVLNTKNSAGAELLIIDNASTDNSLVLCKNMFPAAGYVENSENRGFAQAVNQGLALAKGEYVVLLNPDAVVLDDALPVMTRFMDAHPQAGICGCALLNNDRTLQYSAHHFPRFSDIVFDRTHLAYLLPRSRIFGRYRMTYWNHTECREVDWVSGACCMVRRAAIIDVGRLDERFFMFCEDIDWCRRMKQHQWQVWYVPEATVVHAKGGSHREKGKKAPLQSWKSLVLFWEKYYGRSRARRLAGFLSIDAVLKLGLLAVVYLVSGGNKKIKSEMEYCRELIGLFGFRPS